MASVQKCSSQAPCKKVAAGYKRGLSSKVHSPCKKDLGETALRVNFSPAQERKSTVNIQIAHHPLPPPKHEQQGDVHGEEDLMSMLEYQNRLSV